MKATYTVLLDGETKGVYNTDTTARLAMMELMSDILGRNKNVRLVFFGVLTTNFEINGEAHELKLVVDLN